MTDMDINRLADALAERLAPADGRPLLTVKTLAERLDISERKAAALIAGEVPVIPSFKVDSARRIDPREVDAYVARLREQE